MNVSTKVYAQKVTRNNINSHSKSIEKFTISRVKDSRFFSPRKDSVRLEEVQVTHVKCHRNMASEISLMSSEYGIRNMLNVIEI